jgi:adenylate cyclase
MLSTCYGMAAPLISRGFGGEVEKFIGDAIMVTFNSRGDQPDHAVRAARAGLELQHQMGLLAARHPGWPKLRVGVNTGPALVRAMGGPGYVSFAVVGDTPSTPHPVCRHRRPSAAFSSAREPIIDFPCTPRSRRGPGCG